MRLLNYIYESNEDFLNFIEKSKIQNSNSLFIQLFASNTPHEKVLEVKNFLKKLFPDSSVIGTSTAGVVSYGNVIDNKLIISFSIFENVKTKDFGFCCKDDDAILSFLDKELSEDTKLIVSFANTFKYDASSLLEKISQEHPHIALVGGNAGDDFRFQDAYVISSKHDHSDVVFTIIDSKSLHVKTDYLFNWETIGRSMLITKAKGSTIFEIDHKKAIDVFRHYLGQGVIDNLLEYGMEFPLVFWQGGVAIARAMVAFDEKEGSITFAGTIPEGKEVKFGYANIEHIEDENHKHLLSEHTIKSDAIYVYTCGSRRHMLGNFLNKEMHTLNTIGDSVGFVTYGEFFHNTQKCENNLLNITTTYVCIDEGEKQRESINNSDLHVDLTKKDIRLKGLTTLLKKTSEELDENIYYLEQFKNTVDSASILSITDEKGKITYANKNFQKISGYSQQELLGNGHNVVRHEDMDASIFKKMWKSIKSGKMWKGLVKNRRKDGSSYYVLSEIAPIYNKDGSFREYIGMRTDVTELEEYKAVLQNRLSVSRSSLQENINYIKQFEEAINLTTAVIKTDTNNIIKFVNDKFVSLSGYEENELIGMDCKNLRDEKHKDEETCQKVLTELQHDHFVFETMTNRKKSGEIFITNTLFYPIKDSSGKIIEFVQVMFDVTDIYKLNEEIISTQKEVVEKMGAIGETRSKETGDHVKRVAEYSYLLAKLYGLSEEESLLLKQASPMHDIGKVGIPDSILNKPGKLTTQEFEVMKTHSEIGYEMLKHSNREILKASATVAYTHHEKWDGSGYPKGLSAEEIHIFGRITALADVFDALGHDRVYKKAWKLEDILEYFDSQKGKQFEPKLVEIFFENLDKFLEIQRLYRH